MKKQVKGNAVQPRMVVKGRKVEKPCKKEEKKQKEK